MSAMRGGDPTEVLSEPTSLDEPRVVNIAASNILCMNSANVKALFCLQLTLGMPFHVDTG